MLLQPIQFVVSTLLQPTARHFCKLDDVADCHEFMQSIEADDAFLVLRAALEYIKLTRSLLRVCDDLYQNDDAVNRTLDLNELFQRVRSLGLWYGRPARHWLQRLQDVFALSLPSPFARDDDPEVDEAAAPLVNYDEFAPLPELATQDADNGGTSPSFPSSLPGSATKGKLDGEPPPLVVNTMQSMVEFPFNLKLQFHGLVTVADFAKARENHRAVVVVLTQLNGFDVIVRATDALATSHKAQIITLSLLGNPEDLVYAALDVGGLSAVERCKVTFPDDPRVQTNAELAIAQLLHRPVPLLQNDGCVVQ
ncbi:hypothetical protein DYB38_007662 [Aphanomyces astaci]|uniref:Uncharacterized protein n=1 Tax=Aphanomyces astaci TaxID=112090 RepID=A0A397DD71_APHAT|nr:hypothetical protein DYB38_007662 [Aphanomyces astaci]